MRLAVGLGDIGTDRHAARVRVLDHGHAGILVIPRSADGGVCVLIVVVAHFLAAKLGGVRKSRGTRGIHAGALMRVLPVSQRPAHPARHGHIVGGGVREGLRREFGPEFVRESIARNRFQNARVLIRIDDDANARVVLCRSSDHGGSANIDLLDTLGARGPRGHRLLEGIQIDDHQIDRVNPKLLHLIRVLVALGKDSAVDLGVKGFDAAIKALGETGDVFNGSHRDSGGRDSSCCGAGGDDVQSGGSKACCELFQALLVINGNECLWNDLPFMPRRAACSSCRSPMVPHLLRQLRPGSV